MLDLFFWFLGVGMIGYGAFLVGFGTARERGVAGGVGVLVFAAGVMLSAVTTLW